MSSGSENTGFIVLRFLGKETAVPLHFIQREVSVLHTQITHTAKVEGANSIIVIGYKSIESTSICRLL